MLELLINLEEVLGHFECHPACGEFLGLEYGQSIGLPDKDCKGIF